MVAGFTRPAIGLIAGNIVAAGSRSPCRKLTLNIKTFRTSVPLDLVFSPAPIRRSGANFLTQSFFSIIMRTYSKYYGN